MVSDCAMAETLVGKSELGEDLSVVVYCESEEEMGPMVDKTVHSMLTVSLDGPMDEATYSHTVMGSMPMSLNFDDDEPTNADSAESIESADVASDGCAEDVKIAAGVSVRDVAVCCSVLDALIEDQFHARH